jgi:hypothetical protein
VQIRNRIKELVYVKASELRQNPHNWRSHPLSQREALRGVLAEIGFANAAIARRLSDGGLELIDGHLRRDEAGDEKIPVLVTDLSEEEALKLLAVHDEIAGMAEPNEELRQHLLALIEAEEADFRKMIEELRASSQQATQREERAREDPGGPDGMELRPHEHYDYVVVLARNTQEWNRLLEVLGLEPIHRRGRVGVGRGIPAERMIRLLAERAEPAEAPPKGRKRPQKAD